MTVIKAGADLLPSLDEYLVEITAAAHEASSIVSDLPAIIEKIGYTQCTDGERDARSTTIYGHVLDTYTRKDEKLQTLRRSTSQIYFDLRLKLRQKGSGYETMALRAFRTGMHGERNKRKCA